MDDVRHHRGEMGEQGGHALADTFRCPKKQNLLALARLIEDGAVTPVIDRTYPFAELPAAVRYQEEGHAQGKVVVTV